MASSLGVHLPSLLLLPAPPEPATRTALSAAYRPSLEAALVRTRRDDREAGLIVAIAAPFLQGPNLEAKALQWKETSSLMAGVYAIVAALCAKLSIGSYLHGGAGSVDVRVVLVDYDSSRSALDFVPTIETNSTVVVDLSTFATAYHPWDCVFHVQGEAGGGLLHTYLRVAQKVQQIRPEQLVEVPGGPAVRQDSEAASSVTLSEASPLPPAAPKLFLPTAGHAVVCVGGTFDHLHPGHKLLLAAGALLLKVPSPLSGLPCQYVIGITNSTMLSKKESLHFMQRWSERARNVIDFLGSLLSLSRDGWEPLGIPQIEAVGERDYRASFRDGSIIVQCIGIDDAFGPTATRPDITSLVVSKETRAGGAMINELRDTKGWAPMAIFEVEVLSADEVAADMATDPGSSSAEAAAATEDFASKISSTHIRNQLAAAASAVQAEKLK